MTEIKCLACKPEDRGCARCGGFKVVLEKVSCGKCLETFWFRPIRGTTVYDGKEYESFDGHRMVWKLKDGKCDLYCERCA